MPVLDNRFLCGIYSQKKVHTHGCIWTPQTKTKTYKIYITIISLELIIKLMDILEKCNRRNQIYKVLSKE
jgi:hypothetical protein